MGTAAGLLHLYEWLQTQVITKDTKDTKDIRSRWKLADDLKTQNSAIRHWQNLGDNWPHGQGHPASARELQGHSSHMAKARLA